MAQTLKVLLWKSFTVRKRRWIISLIELITPIVLFWLLVRYAQSPTRKREDIIYDGYSKQYNDLIESVKYDLAYTPSNTFTASIMNEVLKKLSTPDSPVILVSENNENDVVQWLKQQYLDESGKSTSGVDKKYTVGVGVIFSNTDDVQNLQYTLRTTKSYLDTTEESRYGGGGSNSVREYDYSGFLTVQKAIDQAYLSIYHSYSKVPDSVILEILPYIEYNSFNLLTNLFPLMFSLGFSFVIPSLLRCIVEEKTSGTKEMMKIMGLKAWINWINWVVYSWFTLLPVTLAVSWLLTMDLGSGPAIDASFFIVWILFFLFTLALVTLIFVVSTLFTNGTLALIIGLILWYVVTIMLNSIFVAYPDKYGLTINMLTCLWPSIAIQWSINAINNFNKNGHPWMFSNMFEDGAGGGRVSVGLALIMLLVDILLFSIITWYIDNVNPGPYGRAKPFSFIFQCFKNKDYDPKASQRSGHQKNYETPPEDVKVGIRIERLRKTFNSGKVVAVENVDLDIYEGNITALLGHNGAGKTTTMSILAGFYSPTRGKVIVGGKNIFDNMDKFRSSLGLCPQHNLLFSFFTVREHLIFFGMLKGLSKSQSEKEGMELLKLLNVEEKKNQLVSKLSGGMKRKLCLSIALMGDPKVLMLDEPTSGLDPESRRQVWDVLLDFRGQRTTIITTHFMEEADVLGDRIAIMDHGQVSCYGTSMFLKKLYNTGYHLNILKDEQAPVNPITSVVEQHVTSATLKLSTPSQLSYNIKSDESSQFPALFSTLEVYKANMGLTGMGITCSTLEDVFLKVADDAAHNESQTNNHQDIESISKSYKKSSGFDLVLLQLRALVYKKFLTGLRSWISILIYIIVPALAMIYTVYQTMEKSFVPYQPDLPIRLSSFPEAHVAISADNPTASNLIQNLVKSGGGTPDVVPAGTSFNNYLGGQIKNNLIQYEREMIAGFIYNSSNLLGEFSFYSYHSPPLALNMIANILLQQISPKSSISVSNHPIVVQLSMDMCDIAAQASSHVMLFPLSMTFLSLGLMILTMSFISFPLKERVNNSKQLQLMTGLSPLLYWFINLFCDFVVYIVSALLMFIAVYIFQSDNIYSSSGHTGTLMVVFILFGISGITFAYMFSFFVKSSVKASVLFILINMTTGTIASVTLSILGFIFPNLSIYIFLLSFNPIFAASSAVMHLFSVMYIDGTCLQCGKDCSTQDPLKFLQLGPDAANPHGILNFLIFLLVDAILYFSLILIIEYGIAKKLWFLIQKIRVKMDNKILDDDSDVLIEKEKVISSRNVKGYTSSSSVLHVNELGKKYNSKTTAVYEVSFQVGRGECFGLLGVNGAGKTTTFKMLTGEEIPNKGDARVLQFSLNSQKSNFLAKIGYCPQFDAINKLLTGKEMLRVYALLRGIPSSQCDTEVSRWVNFMGLTEYADRPCGTYSGGNKRKLSTAMAFIGEPPVVFLDEPTSGVDPVSRRKLWDVVSKCQQAGQAIVLTSHSMEECEALCSRLTIMVAGQMKCIGTTEYLKHKFGQGFTVKIKLHSSQQENTLDELKQNMRSAFRTCSIKDEHVGLLHYHVPDPMIPLSVLFTKMEGLKRRHGIIEDYNISDTTLEQVFMYFARAQTIEP